MKKITLAAMLLVAAIAFTSCGNPAGSGAGNQNNTGSEDSGSGAAGSGGSSGSNSGTITYDDCTTTITRDQIVLSDGNWEVKLEEEEVNEPVLGTTIFKVTSATNQLTFTAGTYTVVRDLTAIWSNFDNGTGAVDLETLSEEERIQCLAHIYTNYSITFNGKVMTAVRTLTTSELQGYTDTFTFNNSIPETADIKINAAVTKCKISYTVPGYNVRIFAHKL